MLRKEGVCEAYMSKWVLYLLDTATTTATTPPRRYEHYTVAYLPLY